MKNDSAYLLYLFFSLQELWTSTSSARWWWALEIPNLFFKFIFCLLKFLIQFCFNHFLVTLKSWLSCNIKKIIFLFHQNDLALNELFTFLYTFFPLPTPRRKKMKVFLSCAFFTQRSPSPGYIFTFFHLKSQSLKKITTIKQKNVIFVQSPIILTSHKIAFFHCFCDFFSPWRHINKRNIGWQFQSHISRFKYFYH